MSATVSIRLLLRNDFDATMFQTLGRYHCFPRAEIDPLPSDQDRGLFQAFLTAIDG